MDQFTVQNEYAKALENLRNATEKTAKLERENARLLEMVFQFAPAANQVVQVDDDGVVSVAPLSSPKQIVQVNDDGTQTVYDLPAEFETQAVPAPSTVPDAIQYTHFDGMDLPFTPDQPAGYTASPPVLPAEYTAVPQSPYQPTQQRVQRQRVTATATPPPAPSVEPTADRISDGTQASPAISE